ncbi:hypothetical protein GE118_04030 [Mycoplasma sp. NEAQ87857]|uniref:MYPU_1760 family metalloprotease n=1 Tax=Mycoplasma sp. NEAQ87857 TaxID=2683967 RepID=UPI001319A2A0|nr:hypothetical protein [Mycoplasma sp. NEAQ87857]QGZ97945.1 hypothetical protein GE118_04030 [Mycoplasma sp. NEAQ87857]
MKLKKVIPIILSTNFVLLATSCFNTNTNQPKPVKPEPINPKPVDNKQEELNDLKNQFSTLKQSIDSYFNNSNNSLSNKINNISTILNKDINSINLTNLKQMIQSLQQDFNQAKMQENNKQNELNNLKAKLYVLRYQLDNPNRFDAAINAVTNSKQAKSLINTIEVEIQNELTNVKTQLINQVSSLNDLELENQINQAQNKQELNLIKARVLQLLDLQREKDKLKQFIQLIYNHIKNKAQFNLNNINELDYNRLLEIKEQLINESKKEVELLRVQLLNKAAKLNNQNLNNEIQNAKSLEDLTNLESKVNSLISALAQSAKNNLIAQIKQLYSQIEIKGNLTIDDLNSKTTEQLNQVKQKFLDKIQDEKELKVQFINKILKLDNNQFTNEQLNNYSLKELINLETKLKQPKNELVKIADNAFSSFDQDRSLASVDINATNGVNSVTTKMFQGQKEYLEYVDNYTGIKFIEFKIPGHNYFLGASGLVTLAQEFKRKISFGPEVHYLRNIYINFTEAQPLGTDGAYINETRSIYLSINPATYSNVPANLLVYKLMPTLFHEYMHFWAYIYLRTAIKKDNTINNVQNIELVENQDGKLLPKLWNKTFVDKFKTLLNFDFDKVGYLDLNKLRKLYSNTLQADTSNITLWNNLSLHDLWRIGNEGVVYSFNGINNPIYTISPFVNEGLLLNNHSLAYSYGMDELLAREYTKFGYEPYFDMKNQGSVNLFSKPTDINFYGTYAFNGGKTNVYPNAYSEDWSKVYALNLFNYPNLFNENSIMYPNNVFKFDTFLYTEKANASSPSSNQIHTFDANRSNDRTREFYDLYLDYMGYGKSVAQVIFRDSNQEVLQNSKYKISFANSGQDILYFDAIGYLPNKEASGIVAISDGTILSSTLIKYQDTFNFFGHKEIDKGANLTSGDNLSTTREWQINNRIYPETKYYQYYTQNQIKINYSANKYQLKFWKDLNNDNKPQMNEILDMDLTIPSVKLLEPGWKSITKTTSSSNATSTRETIYPYFDLDSDHKSLILKQHS